MTWVTRPGGLLRQLLAKPGPERWLLVSAVAIQALVIAALRIGLRPSWRWPIAGWATGSCDEAARAVAATSGLFHGASTCLSRALAVRCLLGPSSPATVLIGVRTAGAGKLDAHAWVEHAGRPVIGSVPGAPYAAVARLDGGRWRRA